MKTTRRGFLKFLGVGAVAAPVIGKAAVKAMTDERLTATEIATREVARYRRYATESLPDAEIQNKYVYINDPRLG